jgi:hypothetical protein
VKAWLVAAAVAAPAARTADTVATPRHETRDARRIRDTTVKHGNVPPRASTPACAYPSDAFPRLNQQRADGEVWKMRYATTARPAPRVGVSWILVLWLVIGAIVAATHHYWQNVHSLKAIGSGILGTILWPLILLHINLHIH